MTAPAYVNNTRVLADFSAAVSVFAARAIDVLSTIDQTVQKTQEWLEEMRQSWTRVVRRAEEDYANAKNELARRKMMRIGNHPVATSDQELAYRKAKARLEYVQDKLKRTHLWQRDLPQMILDQQPPVRLLQNSIEIDVPKMRTFLDQKIHELEQYAREQI